MAQRSLSRPSQVLITSPHSLQATYIRNTIIHALRSSSNVNIHDIPTNFVYTNPTIIQLTAYVLGLLSGKATDLDVERNAAIARMRALLEKYSAELHSLSPAKLPNGNGHAANEKSALLQSQKKSDRKIRRSVLRFAEQSWSLIYYTVQWGYGLVRSLCIRILLDQF